MEVACSVNFIMIFFVQQAREKYLSLRKGTKVDVTTVLEEVIT